MPGSQKNEWNSYLNGRIPQYNFSYTDESLNTSLEPILDILTKHKTSPFNSNPYIKNKKQTAGKRKSRRHTKKYRHSRRK